MTPTHGHTSVGRTAKILIRQLYVDTRFSQEGLPKVMANRVARGEKPKRICDINIDDDDDNEESNTPCDVYVFVNLNLGCFSGFFFCTAN